MRAQCDHCGEVTDHVRPKRIALRQQMVCRSCRQELGMPDEDDVEEESSRSPYERERHRIQYHGG
jgi:hypothetical protein